MPTAPSITPREAMARLARGERLAFVDARRDDRRARTSCRLPGAVRFGPGSGEREAVALPADAVLVVYGDHGHSSEPDEVAGALLARGFAHVRVLAGGFLGWTDLRCPIELAAGRPRGFTGRKAAAPRSARASVAHP